MINIYESARFKLKKKWLMSTIQSYLDQHSVSPDLLINFIFVGRRKMLHIATTYKHEPEALPVLCFPYITNKRMIFVSDGNTQEMAQAPQSIVNAPVDEKLLGEVFICFPQAVLLAAEKSKKVNDMMIFLIHHAIDNLLLGKQGTHHRVG
ncbi:MAG: rRNA maturation RNAse YbeY [Candidatus Roizmanbacteria bacterium]